MILGYLDVWITQLHRTNFCAWKGAKYRELLYTEAPDNTTFEKTVRQIVDIKRESCEIDKTHYFKVEIIGYSSEIVELLDQINFEASLTRLLPIKYSDSFTSSDTIIRKYREFMNEDLTDFMCSVMLNGVELKKSYNDDIHVLDSNIVFWEIREKGNGSKKPGDKIGLLWFTFNRKMTASKNDIDYGIMVRSKNVLMGNNDTFATLCANSKERVGTFSELTATLRGVYGEFLINSPNLEDNARREWFKTDEHSVYLKYVIVDFMRRLYAYRYAASRYFRMKTDDAVNTKKMRLKKALIELVDVENNEINVSDFFKSEAQEAEKTEKNDNKASSEQGRSRYSTEDIPREAQTKRKNYDELMIVIEEFFEKEKLFDVFLKLRAYIKNHFGR
jgi:molecular chaperone HtpG